MVRNFNEAELQVIFHYNQTYFDKKTIWHILKPVYSEIFNERPLKLVVKNEKEDEDDLCSIENYFKSFQNSKITNLQIHRAYILTISYFIENNYHDKISESIWDDIFIYMHNYLKKIVEKSKISVCFFYDLFIIGRNYRFYIFKKKNC